MIEVFKRCFAILKGNMTSCLVECAFMTNLDVKLISFKNKKISDKNVPTEIVQGILEYFGINQRRKG